MPEQFLVFQSFTDPAIAQEVAECLKDNSISYEIEDTSSPIDPVIIGSPLAADIKVKIRQQDFTRALEALESFYDRQVELIDKDYFIFSFSNDELLDVLKKPDEWGSLNYNLSRRILKGRGVTIDKETLEKFKSERLTELAKPDEADKTWSLLEYSASITFSLVGIFLSAMIISSKKVLPNGERVYVYNADSRQHAKMMMIISIGLTLFWFWLIFTGRR